MSSLDISYKPNSKILIITLDSFFKKFVVLLRVQNQLFFTQL